MYLYLSIVLIGFLILAYCIRLFRAPFFSLAEDSLSLVNTLLLKIDEDEKVKLVQTQNTKLIISLMKVFGSVLFAIVIASIPFVIYCLLFDKTYEELNFSSFESIIALSIGSTLGFFIPTKKKSTEGYSELSQLLHRLALNNYAIAYKLFKIEAKKMAKKGVSEKNQFVIVSGLARSGTTSLMNRLLENDIFRSLDYSNMPFITAPNLWKKFYNPKGSEKKERSHKDGIMIGLESNEALEEYFFKVLDQDSYIKEDALEKYNVSDENYKDYLKYQAFIRNDDKTLYLAKNNNFILRYESIRKINPDFLVVFMFRDPMVHAASLLEKHKEYSKMQEDDPFVLEYMNWLGHHEFGLNQKPFKFSSENQDWSQDKLKLDYWLQVWINYYNYLLTLDHKNILIVDYDDYCKEPKSLLENIYKMVGINFRLENIEPFHNKREISEPYTESLKSEAYKVLDLLKHKK